MLSQAVEQSNIDFSEGLRLVLCDPMFSTHLMGELSNSKHSHLKLQNMGSWMDLLPTLMDLGMCDCIFCCALYFKTWYKLSVMNIEQVVKEEQPLDSEERSFQSKTFSELEANALHYMQSLWVYKGEPQMKRLQHSSIAESAIHFWQTEIPCI